MDGWHATLYAARFNVWAQRGVHVIWSDSAVRHFDGWLVGYANATLAVLTEFFARNPPPGSADPILLDTRNRLAAQIQHWKAEARRYRAEQEEHQRTTESPTAAATSVALAGDSDGSATPPENRVVDAARPSGHVGATTAATLPSAQKPALRTCDQPEPERIRSEHSVIGVLGTAEERRAAVNAYIAEVYAKTEKIITRQDIWKSARYQTRSEFERWQRCARNVSKGTHERFVRILTDKPHLK